MAETADRGARGGRTRLSCGGGLGLPFLNDTISQWGGKKRLAGVSAASFLVIGAIVDRPRFVVRDVYFVTIVGVITNTTSVSFF
jgi:hypothetical protein